MTYLEELKDVIRCLHGVESAHVQIIPVKEIFQGKTVWDGIVEVFDLKNHPTAARIYAWAHDTDGPNKPRRHVTVLHETPVDSPEAAVRASIIQDYRNLETE